MHATASVGRITTEFVCPHDDYRVSEFQADVNLAENIVSHANRSGKRTSVGNPDAMAPLRIEAP